jgi:hypothetical protein
MVARNDITGDVIQSKTATQSYRDNYDNIFRKNKMQVRVQEDESKVGQCGCGRSPTGKCIGWHGLTEEQYQDRLEKYNTNQESLSGESI